jgi:methionyl-tRNA formyltransferase
VPALRALASAGMDVTCVLTQPDRPAGRGRRLTPPPVKRAALELGLPVHQPASLRGLAAPEAQWGEQPDLLIVAAYGLMLPAWALNWPTHPVVNLHASLLPRWRGAAPIHYAILAGDKKTGVSLMEVRPALDAGPVYATRELTIGATETAGELHLRLADLAAQLLMTNLEALLEGRLVPTPQDEAAVTHAPKIEKREGRLAWHESAMLLERRVRAYNPWPIAEGLLSDGRRLRIWRAAESAGAALDRHGAIISADAAGIAVATGAGVLRILEVQPPSGRPMPVASYLAAHDLTGVKFVSED